MSGTVGETNELILVETIQSITTVSTEVDEEIEHMVFDEAKRVSPETVDTTTSTSVSDELKIQSLDSDRSGEWEEIVIMPHNDFTIANQGEQNGKKLTASSTASHPQFRNAVSPSEITAAPQLSTNTDRLTLLKIVPNSVDENSDSDPDEPLLSGSGQVRRECSEQESIEWMKVLTKWRQDFSIRPKELDSMVKKGIPNAFRCEIWQLLAQCPSHENLLDEYRILSMKQSQYDKMILSDISRTFPANEKFREAGSAGQSALYRLCTAYANYDREIGYCQGLTFVAAALLLQMPEEQAFCLLVQIMNAYGMRNLFRSGFEELQLRFFQLQCLMVQELNDLHQHFLSIGVEPHMFASQWFLTLFTAKFPLPVVFYVLDLFLVQGMDTVLQVSSAFLKMSREELLKQDFEGAMKHFRVHLPKKYKSDEIARVLLAEAVAVKTNKLAKYEKMYSEQRKKVDSVDRLTRENKLLLKNNLRLERENQLLANDLVNSKIRFQRELDIVDDKLDTLNKELLMTRTSLADTEEEKKRFEEQIMQVKDVCRREISKSESKAEKHAKINDEYKVITSKLSQEVENGRAKLQSVLQLVEAKFGCCENCKPIVEEIMTLNDNGENIWLMAINQGHQKIHVDGEQRIRELESELAKTKLALVEAECQNEEIIHQMSLGNHTGDRERSDKINLRNWVKRLTNSHSVE